MDSSAAGGAWLPGDAYDFFMSVVADAERQSSQADAERQQSQADAARQQSQADAEAEELQHNLWQQEVVAEGFIVI